MFLSVSLRCEMIETKEDAFFRSLTYRQRYVSTYESAARSTLQTIFEIAAVKASYEETHTAQLSRSDLADLWVRKSCDLPDDEDCPKTAFEFVDSAMKVFERILSVDKLFDVVFRLEQKYGKQSCFQHMAVLEGICIKTKKSEDLLWILESMEDLLIRGESNNKCFSSRTLKGGRTGGGTRGLLDEFLAKKSIFEYVLEESQKWGLKPAHANGIKKVMISHSEVRKRLFGRVQILFLLTGGCI